MHDTANECTGKLIEISKPVFVCSAICVQNVTCYLIEYYDQLINF